MFVARNEGGTIYGLWTVKQFEGQEELPDDHPDIVALRTARAAAEAQATTERDGQAALAADARADAIFTALQTATPAQIATFVGNRFPAFDAPQRAVIRLLLQVAALTLRRAG